jgi:HPt (histidine-containing phosphotransfer) domain-containing protein
MPPRTTEFSNLEHLFKGDQALIREWIGLYLQESPKYFQQLSAGLKSGDAQAMANASHDLQAQAHYLGSPRMLELLIAIEEQAVAKGAGSCVELMNALVPLREGIDRELREMLSVS